MAYLNFNLVADQLRELSKTYFPNGVPKVPDARQEQFDKFDEDPLEEDIEQMEDKFWKRPDELEKALLEPINNSGIRK